MAGGDKTIRGGSRHRILMGTKGHHTQACCFWGARRDPRVVGTAWGGPRGYLAVTADGLPALLASAGVEGLKARHAVGAVLPEDILLAEERFFAMVAVKSLSHPDAQPFNSLSAKRKRTFQ